MINIDPPPGRPLRERIQTPGIKPATTDQWRSAYDAKVAELARETARTSTLIRALHALGCRATGAHSLCPGCVALAAVAAAEPTPSS